MKAVVLLSGGIDSAATLYYAKAKGYKCVCLSFDYGQRHRKEIRSARAIAAKSGSGWTLLKISLPWKGSALLDKSSCLPAARIKRRDIPPTYVPGRNIIFLSYALSLAEAGNADAVFIGANQVDYSGYPDCRGEFLKAFSFCARKGTKRGAEGRAIEIKAPFLDHTKEEIIRAAIKYKVPLKYTWSCYKGAKRPCGACDSCLIRRTAFKNIKIKDPADE